MPSLDYQDATLWFDTSGDGELLIALHGGLGLDHSYLRPWLDPLSTNVTLAYLDFRANGRSTGEGDDLTMQRLAADVDALRKHLGHPRTWLLGHSYGGFVALEFALTYPEALHGLVLLDTDSTSPAPETVAAGLQRLGVQPDALAVLEEPVDNGADLLRLFDVAGPWYLPHSEVSAARAVMGQTIYRKGGSDGGVRALQGWDVTGRLGEIDTPTLVITGVDDFMFPPMVARRLSGAIASSDLLVVPESGHLPFVEQTDTVLGAVRAFLNPERTQAIGRSVPR